MPKTLIPPIPILYQDEQLVIVHKPAGLLVHRSAIDRHETQFAMQRVRDQIGQRVYPVHRLDKPTSGILVFALNADMARLTSEQFARREVTKRYLAVVRGWPGDGMIDYPLKEVQDAYTDELADPHKAAQAARTAYRTLARCELPIATGRYLSARCALVELSPESGRKHQIRRHLKHVFHPLIGDTSYGDGAYNRLFRDHLDCHRLLLTAVSLGFHHPLSQKPLTISSTQDESFNRICKRIFTDYIY